MWSQKKRNCSNEVRKEIWWLNLNSLSEIYNYSDGLRWRKTYILFYRPLVPNSCSQCRILKSKQWKFVSLLHFIISNSKKFIVYTLTVFSRKWYTSLAEYNNVGEYPVSCSAIATQSKPQLASVCYISRLAFCCQSVHYPIVNSWRLMSTSNHLRIWNSRRCSVNYQRAENCIYHLQWGNFKRQRTLKRFVDIQYNNTTITIHLIAR